MEDLDTKSSSKKGSSSRDKSKSGSRSGSDRSGKSSSSSSGSPSKEGKADHVIVRNLFVYAINRRLVILFLAAAAAAALSIFSAYQVMNVKTPPQYIQLSEDGRIFHSAPLNEANVSEGEILQFALESAKWINTYDYINWKDQLQSNANRFSPEGWNGFVNSLVASDNLNAVQARKMVVTSRPTGEPRVVKEGVAAEINRYVWMVEIPLEIIYTAPASDSTTQSNIQSGKVTMYISRVPLETSLRGHAIQVYTFEEKANN